MDEWATSLTSYEAWDNLQPLVPVPDRGRLACQAVATTRTGVGKSNEGSVREALDTHGDQFPFVIRGMDSHNGSDFINHHLVDWCDTHHITVIRSRAYHKNDGCYVEQKNWTVGYVGYLRYEGAEQVGWLSDLYATLRRYTNFFQPLQKSWPKNAGGPHVPPR